MSAERSPNYPSRSELLAWGLQPCRSDGCRVLVNPHIREATGLCATCQKREEQRREGGQR